MPHSRLRCLGATLGVTASATTVILGLAPAASAAPPATQEYFICPSVSTHNANGTWVIGSHGAYYVLVPTQGATGSRVYLTVPTTAFDRAQIPAGWALYKDVIHTTAPDETLVFTTDATAMGAAMLLAEGLAWFPGAEALGWAESDQVTITADGAGGYLAHDFGNPMMGTGDKGTIALPNSHVPAASGALW